MADPEFHERRRVLVTTGGLVAMGLAGCLSSQESGTPHQGPDADGQTRDQEQGTQPSSDEGGRTDDGSKTGGEYGDGSGPDDTNRSGERDDAAPGDDAESGGGDAGGAELEIVIQSDEFVPRIERLAVGGTVRFVCREGFHTTTLYHPQNDGKPQRAPANATVWDSGTMESGDTFEVTIDQPGVYDYFCKPHEGVGMVGSLVVGDNADPAQPGLSEPRDLPLGATEKLGELNAEAEGMLGIGDNGGDGGTDGPDEEEGNGGDGGNDGSPGQANLEVTVVSDRFSPQIDRIQTGGTVRFVCQDGSHTATLYHPDNGGGLPRRAPAGAASFASGFLEPGDSFEVTLDQPGVYDYFCRPHQDEGMVGSIVVGDNADPGQAGLSDPNGVPEVGAARQLRRLNDQARNLLDGGGDGGGGDGGGGDGGGGDGGGVDAPIERQERDGEIFIGVEGTKAPGNEVTIVATLDGTPVTDAPVRIDDRFVGRTDDEGRFGVTLGQRFRVRVSANGVRGRYRLRFE